MAKEKPAGTVRTAYDLDNEPYLVEASGTAAKRVVDILNADNDGRLLVLPCKVGDTVYTIWDNEVRDNTVTALVVDGLGQHILAQYNRGGAIRDYNVDCLGKTVFLTRKAAEEAIGKCNK